jgi:SNF2-related domain/SNF2 Helicase protein/Helicase conserved C-terminal domain
MAVRTPFLTLHVTPRGHLVAAPEDGAPPIDAAAAERLGVVFAEGAGPGLLQLGASEVTTPLPAVIAFWRAFAARYVTAVCHAPDDAGRTAVEAPPAGELTDLATAAPPMTGFEYLNADVLAALWAALDTAFRATFVQSGRPLQEFLHDRHPAWSVVGRVHFNLAEYKLDLETPFAFLATYTTSLSASGTAQHAALGRALTEYAGAANRSRLLALLVPLQRAAERCEWLKAIVDNGDVFHPLRWTAADAYRFLQAVPQFEAAGLVVRLPASWRMGRPPRPRATATVGTKAPSGLGTSALLDFHMDVTLDGKTLTKKELALLLAATDGLHFIRGRWVEVKREALQRMIAEFERVERLSKAGGVTFAEAMRLVAGAVPGEDAAERGVSREWSEVATGPWLRETLAGLRSPEGLARAERSGTGPRLQATLRPYQEVGVRWLHLLSSLGLGACLADDMGLGKTLQVLALLAGRAIPEERSAGVDGPHLRPTLIVSPASLVANWTAEMARFTPALRVLVAHPSAMPRPDLVEVDPAELGSRIDVVVTSYGTLARLPWIAAARWDLVVLDEAQAIKNPAARQTRAAKTLNARARIALTGTPVENRLTDLWSIFDAINPGLLGAHQTFARWTKSLAAVPQPTFGPLRELVRPYILRRMKTDPAVIRDLPAKTEVPAFCALSARQAALYQQSVDELARRLETVSAIERRGLVLAYLMRFKQIANHPSQWLGDGRWSEADSGKFRRLREIADTIAARQEKVLVFTQFREITGALSVLLESVFGRPGAVLHGGTPVALRRSLVTRFQEDDATPFFVLSLKAGGTGLNLTSASHVIHFDRWWNPAVEDQATDRAFRIGQTKPVLVHKFLCRGTVEEKIDALIASKRRLSDEVLAGGGSAELALTEMPDDELLRLVALDIHRAAAET